MTPYFEKDGVTLYNADCREVLPTLPEKSAGLVLTDPPFEAEAHTLQRRINRSQTRSQPTDKVVAEPLPFPPLTPDVRAGAAREMARIAGGWVLAFCQVEAAMLWRAEFEAAGLTYKRTCIWVKPDGMPQYSGDRPGMGYESIVACHPPGRSTWNGGGSHGVFTYAKNDGIGPAPHPTTKPQSLMRKLVSLFSDEGDLILDPFAGSGSTLIAAFTLGRQAIGIEIEECYCEVAARRLEREMAQGSLFKRGVS